MTTTTEGTENDQTAVANTENISSAENDPIAVSDIENISSARNIPQEIMDIMEYLSCTTSIIFKSQQRDEPELQKQEKLKVALDVYQRNPQTFLIRFGNYLEEHHLQNFARLSIADSDEEMHLMVRDYQCKLRTRQRDIKNRRYTAMQKLIEQGEYFSELEMMKRQPELYQDLVGQYLSNKEKQQRDCYDVRNTTFSGILMHNLEQKQLNEIMEKANVHAGETSPSDDIDCLEKEEYEIPINCRQQWGNFDNEQIACSSSKMHNKKSLLNNEEVKMPPVLNLITADERELLRQEFISQMHEQFLTGQDKDFDYAAVDDNTQFDDLNLINQDKEDKYFDGSDDDSIHEENDENSLVFPPNNMDDESEDELDAYMSHLNNHHSLQKHNKD